MYNLKKIATIDQTLNKDYIKTEIRKASRAIIIKDNLVLMIRSGKNGDFKFPGGGRKVFESAIDNLIRETNEETGYEIIRSSVRELGYIEELYNSNNMTNGLFKMISEYYICDISYKQNPPKLDAYERNLDYQAMFVDPTYALRENEKLDFKKYHWIVRENLILKIVIRMMGENNEGANLL